MDSNGLTDLRELHRDHVVFQELFWTESFEWRDEMDNFCGISRICNYLNYNFNGKMSHRRHLNTKQFLERKLINSLKNNNFFSKGEGGILLFSYKVVEFFVDIIYESTFGGYEKVLGISRPEKKKFEF